MEMKPTGSAMHFSEAKFGARSRRLIAAALGCSAHWATTRKYDNLIPRPATQEDQTCQARIELSPGSSG
jgi:hypothetical protein